MSNMTKRAVVCLTVTLAIVGGKIAVGQTYTVSAAVSAAYEADGITPVTPVPDTTNPVATPYVYRVDLNLHTDGFTGSQRGFSHMTFNVALLGSITNSTFPGWNATNTLVSDPNGPPGSTVILLADNGNVGDPSSLSNIHVGVLPGITEANDPRLNVGQNPPYAQGTPLGSVYVNWDGISVGELRITPTNIPLPATYNPDGSSTPDASIVLSGSSVYFGVPEPSAALLLSMSLPALGWMARRTRRRNVA